MPDQQRWVRHTIGHHGLDPLPRHYGPKFPCTPGRMRTNKKHIKSQSWLKNTYYKAESNYYKGAGSISTRPAWFSHSRIRLPPWGSNPCTPASKYQPPLWRSPEQGSGQAETLQPVDFWGFLEGSHQMIWYRGPLSTSPSSIFEVMGKLTLAKKPLIHQPPNELPIAKKLKGLDLAANTVWLKPVRVKSAGLEHIEEIFSAFPTSFVHGNNILAQLLLTICLRG